MNQQPLATFGKIAALALAGWLFIPGQAAAVPDDGYELLTRGPIHEAFAGTVTYDPEPGIIIDTAPPGAIEELPPEQQPEGENVVWIPGYWAWDEEQDSFLWVSGIWRNLPPGREWVPGYWNPVTDDRFQWISGYWADTGLTQVSYLPAPPRSIESGPSIAAASTDQVWLPGTWVHQRNNYAWRSGYWSAPREHWVYVPATYVWTPRGYIFVDGYWDYAIPRRGVVFAPVYYHRPVYAVAGYRHSPSLVISLSLFTDHLFLRPSYRHYYFGDYYAPSYRTRGYYACHYYHNTRRGYDPVYAYNRWSHRNDRHWEHNYRSRYDRLRDREGARPPRTWSAMQSRPDYRDSSRMLAAPIERYARNREATDGQRFRNVDRSAREQIATQTREVRNFRNERQKTEGRAGRIAQAPDTAMNVERSRSPIASRERATGRENNRRSDARTPDETATSVLGRTAREPERGAREADRTTRVPERADLPSSRPDSTRRETRSERVRPSQRELETPGVVPQPRRTEETRSAERPTRVQPPQRTETIPQRTERPQRIEPSPQRAERPQRTEPTPQRAQSPQRQQTTPQRAERPQRSEPTPQRAQQSQRQQPTPQRAERPQRTELTPQRAQQSQRQQPTPQRAQSPQRQQPTPQRAQSSQRQQPTPQRAQSPQRQQPTPQRAQSSQRQQPTPQRAQQSQRQQPTPQRAQQSPQRQQPTPQRAQSSQRSQPTPQRAQRESRREANPKREESRGSDERGNRRNR